MVSKRLKTSDPDHLCQCLKQTNKKTLKADGLTGLSWSPFLIKAGSKKSTWRSLCPCHKEYNMYKKPNLVVV